MFPNLSHHPRQRNVVVDDEGNGLLIDFGLSRIKHEVTRTKTGTIQGGMYRYLAPELWSLLLSDGQFRTTYASDSYAFAMTILEMVSLQHPYPECRTAEAAAQQAAEGKRPLRSQHVLTLPSHVQNALWSLLDAMWAHDPEIRPHLEMVEVELQNIWSLLARTSVAT